MFEEWRRLPDPFSGYEVSSLGRVRGTRGVLSQQVSEKGYIKVGLWINGKASLRRVHMLVASAFIGQCPDGHEVNHKDTNRANNRADNLEYLTRHENAKHAILHGRKNRKVSVEDVRLLRSTTTPTKAEARRLGVSPKFIRQIRQGECWREADITPPQAP